MDTNLSQALGEIQRSLGNIEGNIKGMKEAFEQHVAADADVEVRVRGVEIALAKQKGAARVWNLVGTGAGAIVGAVAAYFGAKHV
jgi:gas vesicle protein